MTITAGEVSVLASGFDSPEGPAFDPNGNLYFVNWNSSQIMRRTPQGEVAEIYNTGGIPAGLAFHPDGSLWIADEGPDIHGVIRLDRDGTARVVVNEYEGQPLNGANDLVFDRTGVLYFSDPWGSGPDNPAGGFYRYFPDGRLEQIDTGLKFPNGVAINADETAVYLAETYENRILRYELGRDGSVGSRQVWARTEEPSGPDGMAFDSAGNLLVAHYNKGRVDVFNPDGKQIDAIAVPGNCPTNCAFGGPDGTTLVITEVETASLYTVEMTNAGQQLHDR
jgi:gluconolactonase